MNEFINSISLFISRMSRSDVFRPSDGPLLVRGGISEGPAVSMDAFRKRMGSGMGSRPGTSNSGYRFGQLSHNSFFARHNPHPGRVRHIKGEWTTPSFLGTILSTPSLFHVKSKPILSANLLSVMFL